MAKINMASQLSATKDALEQPAESSMPKPVERSAAQPQQAARKKRLVQYNNSLDPDVVELLEQVAANLGRTQRSVLEEAIQDYAQKAAEGHA